MMRKLGVVEQLFTSDGQWFLNDSVPLRPASDVLLTVNFMKDKEAFTNLKRLQVSARETVDTCMSQECFTGETKICQILNFTCSNCTIIVLFCQDVKDHCTCTVRAIVRVCFV